MTQTNPAPGGNVSQGRDGAHILIVDDGDNGLIWSRVLAAHGCTTTLARTNAHGLGLLQRLHPDHLLLGVGEETQSDLELINAATKLGIDLVAVGPTQPEELPSQVLSAGAREYLTQPVAPERLWPVLNATVTPRPEPGTDAQDGSGLLLGRSAVMQAVFEQVRRVAPTSATVLITGESGTGKEMVAQTIHRMSSRNNRPFIALNCGAIPAQLIESELFGHEKGSFTGAIRDHRGYFERAHGGTLFLDEIIEMPIELQVKLLRVLEARLFSRVGSVQVHKTDVRIIAATNQSPQQAITEGKLRADLLYRIQVFPIALPPMRERGEDIPLLANYFLQALNQSEGRHKQFSQAALAALCEYAWPGNLRELKNVVYRGYIMADQEISLSNLPLDITDPAPCSVGPSLTVTIGSSLADVERQLILETLHHCGGKRDRAARVLGISPKTLYNRLRDYGHPPAPRSAGPAEAQSAAPPVSSHNPRHKR